VQHDGCDWRCLVADGLALISEAYFPALSRAKFASSPTVAAASFATPRANRSTPDCMGRMRRARERPGPTSHSVIALLAETSSQSMMTYVFSITK
jgi:hypothetical protein